MGDSLQTVHANCTDHFHSRRRQNGSASLLYQEVGKDSSTGFAISQATAQYLERLSMKAKHLGSNLDDFLEEEGLLVEAEVVAVKRVLAFQLAQLMAKQQVSKSEMARRMNTSRTAVERLLNPESEAATLTTLEKAASALGKRLHVELV